MILGYSLLEGIGRAHDSPHLYPHHRLHPGHVARGPKRSPWFLRPGGLGSASGPLIGGADHERMDVARCPSSAEVVVIILILVSSHGGSGEPGGGRPRQASTSSERCCRRPASVFVVAGILQAGAYGWVHAAQGLRDRQLGGASKGDISPVWLWRLSALCPARALRTHLRRRERAGRAADPATAVQRPHRSSLAW